MTDFSQLPPVEPDVILHLMKRARADERPEKIDLGIGVYRDENMHTPVMKAVKAAERLKVEAEDTKVYLGLSGDQEFAGLVARLALGESMDDQRLAKLQTPSGSGAIFVIAGVHKMLAPDAQVWMGEQYYFNHMGVFRYQGFRTRSHPFLGADESIDFDPMIGALEQGAKPGDLLVLHASCHNPTGLDFSLEQWEALTDICERKGMIPYVDSAYQGFAKGMDQDVAGLRHMAGRLENMYISYSCSKNFGLYRERTGAAMMLTKNADQKAAASAAMEHMARIGYSMPPQHGAGIVKIILNDEQLTAQWQEELASYRDRVTAIRSALAAELRKESNSNRFDFIEHQFGMFSTLPINQAQAERLVQEHAVYAVPLPDQRSRINLISCPLAQANQLAKALVAVSN